eukprot:767597-Hanusia_phi.AAC.7
MSEVALKSSAEEIETPAIAHDEIFHSVDSSNPFCSGLDCLGRKRMPKAFDSIGAANYDFPVGGEVFFHLDDALYDWLAFQNDVLANANMREKKTKEAWLKIMHTRHLRHLLRECYRRGQLESEHDH